MRTTVVYYESMFDDEPASRVFTDDAKALAFISQIVKAHKSLFSVTVEPE